MKLKIKKFICFLNKSSIYLKNLFVFTLVKTNKLLFYESKIKANKPRSPYLWLFRRSAMPAVGSAAAGLPTVGYAGRRKCGYAGRCDPFDLVGWAAPVNQTFLISLDIVKLRK